MLACCLRCEFVNHAAGGLLCDHHALADWQNFEAGHHDSYASDEGIALGREIERWRDGLNDEGCPGLEGDDELAELP
jgi:hypothetical protein